MAFEMFARLNFSAPGVQSKIKSIQKSFRSLKTSANTLGRGVTGIGEGVRGLALATAPAAIALGSAVREAGLFEQTLADVRAVTGSTKDEIVALAVETKRLGIVTRFTASESNKGAEEFARAGFTLEEIINSLGAALDTAAANNISVSKSAGIVVSSLKAFSLEATEAVNVADILSQTARLTNTNIIDLAEGMKLVSNSTRGLGLSLADTSTAVGVLSNVGVKGTLAGTAIRNALQKLQRPSEKALKFFGPLGDLALETRDKVLPLEEIFARIQQVIQSGGDEMTILDRAREATELLGIRGNVALGAFAAQMKKTFTVKNEKQLKTIQDGFIKVGSTADIMGLKVGDSLPNLVALRLRIAGANGVISEMAQTRLDTFFGQIEKFKSAITGLKIEIGSLLLDDLTAGLKTVTDAFAILAVSFQKLSPEQMKRTIDGFKKGKNEFISFIPLAQEFAKGFKDGFKEVIDVAKTVFAFIKEKFLAFQKQTGLSAEDVGKFTAKFLIIAAIAAPILAAMAIGLFVFGQIALGVVGIFNTIIGVVGLLKGTFTILFNAVRIGFVLMAQIGGKVLLIAFIKIIAIVGILTFLWVNFKDRFISTWNTIIEFFIPTINKIKNKISEIGDLGFTGLNLENVKENFITTFVIIKKAISGALDVILPIIEGIAFVFSIVFDGLVSIAISAFESILSITKTIWNEVVSTIEAVGPDIMQIISDIGDIFSEVFGSDDEMRGFKEGVLTTFNFIGAIVKNVMEVMVFNFKTAFKIIGFAVSIFIKSFAFGLRTLVTVARVVIGFIRDLFTGEGSFVAGVKETFFKLKNFIMETFNVFQQGNEEGGLFRGLEQGLLFFQTRVHVVFAEMVPKIIAIIAVLIKKVKAQFKEIPTSIGDFAESKFLSFLDIEISRGSTKEEIAKNKERRKRDEISRISKAAAAANKTANRSKVVAGGGGDDGILATLRKILDSGKDGDQKPIVVNSKIICDGQTIARAVSKANGENSERQGVKVDGFKRGLVERAPTGTEAR